MLPVLLGTMTSHLVVSTQIRTHDLGAMYSRRSCSKASIKKLGLRNFMDRNMRAVSFSLNHDTTVDMSKRRDDTTGPHVHGDLAEDRVRVFELLQAFLMWVGGVEDKSPTRCVKKPVIG